MAKAAAQRKLTPSQSRPSPAPSSQAHKTTVRDTSLAPSDGYTKSEVAIILTALAVSMGIIASVLLLR
ncbi:MAG: hypothetical protein IT381_01535 [Deltaproteobacteria bacterium]|nr:hypothetical protein [Deltaproteobacteria bacterium]